MTQRHLFTEQPTGSAWRTRDAGKAAQGYRRDGGG